MIKQGEIKKTQVFKVEKVVRKFEVVSLSHQTIAWILRDLAKHVTLIVKIIIENFIFFIDTGRE